MKSSLASFSGTWHRMEDCEVPNTHPILLSVLLYSFEFRIKRRWKKMPPDKMPLDIGLPGNLWTGYTAQAWCLGRIYFSSILQTTRRLITYYCKFYRTDANYVREVQSDASCLGRTDALQYIVGFREMWRRLFTWTCSSVLGLMIGECVYFR